MNVLSLYDGISCGMIALNRAGLKVDNYYAYEIEPSAIAISRYNFPGIIQCGDVFNANFADMRGKIDMVIGGSPCTYWSIAQSPEKREIIPSGIGWDLFYMFVLAIETIQPKYFIYENNASMSLLIQNEITKLLKVPPILINSALVSCQNRKRLYWTNIIGVTQPKDKGIKLSSILESGKVDRDKGLCLTRRYSGFSGSQSYMCRRYFGKSMGQAVFEGDIDEIRNKWKNDPYFISNERNIRQMTVKECEKYQTIPVGFVDNVPNISKKQKIEALGNGWTVDVIAHILSFIDKGVNQ